MWRPMRWYWAAAISLASFWGAGLLAGWLLFGTWPPMGGVLDPVADALFSGLGTIVGDTPAFYMAILLLASGPFLAGLTTYALLRRRSRSEQYLRCLNCGHILKGLTEPRCPECGERI